MGSGKTQFVMHLVDSADAMIEPTPCKIVYYFAEYQPLFEHYEDRIEFRHGMPKVDVIDRLTDTLDQRLTRMFTRGLHHRNVLVIFMVQNFFNKYRHMRTISLNAQYIVLFKNPRDSSQFVHLAKKLYPHNSRFEHEAYVDATKRPYGYILLDLRSDQRLRTNIFPGKCQIVYVPK